MTPTLSTKRHITLFCALFVALLSASLMGQNLVVSCYNLRNDNKGDADHGDGWAVRCPVIASMIRFHGFQIIGTQECKANQLDDLVKQLGGEFAFVGIGRSDGKRGGEHSAIFYKKSEFELLDSGNFWLSEITDKPNKGWDASHVRICSWGSFKQISTGFKFYVFNVHFDHIGVKARLNSAHLILEKIKTIAAGAPTMFMGDLNVDRGSESYLVFKNSGILTDSYELATVRYELNGSINEFNPNAVTSSVIDHIFVTKEFRVKRYGILTDSYRSKVGASDKQTQSANFPKEVTFSQYTARLPSDHFPIVVELCKP